MVSMEDFHSAFQIELPPVHLEIGYMTPFVPSPLYGTGLYLQ